MTAPDQTNAEVSDERLRDCPFCGGANIFVQNAGWQANTFMRCPDCRTTFSLDNGTPRSHADTVAAWNRRSVTSQASEGEPSLPRMDDIAAASIKYICADCAREESEYSCHSIEDVVIINDEVICLDHAKELHADQQRRKAPDVAAKLRRQRMSIATYQKAAENAPVSKRVERLETALKPFAAAAEDLDEHAKDHEHLWETPAALSMKAGDLRAARQALHGDRS